MPGYPLTALATGAVTPAWAQEATLGPAIPSDASRQQQLDRIEAKLDALLEKLGAATGATGVPAPSGPAGTASPASEPPTAAPVAAAPPATGAATEIAPTPTDTPSEAESYTPGAIAVAHAAPAKGQALGEIPADSIGGFVYTGGPIRLSDLADRGVRYSGPAGIELQGWLRATETGRHQVAIDLQVRFGAGAISPLPCTFSAWLEDQGSAARHAPPNPGAPRANPCPSPSSSAPSCSLASTSCASGSPAPTSPPPATARGCRPRF